MIKLEDHYNIFGKVLRAFKFDMIVHSSNVFQHKIRMGFMTYREATYLMDKFKKDIQL